MPKISIAEESGMPFQTRCEHALMSLKRIWILFQNLSTEDVRFRQERVHRREAFLGSVTESRREKVAGLLGDIIDTRAQMDEQFYKSMWEGELEFTREVYGSDATDFALKALESTRARN